MSSRRRRHHRALLGFGAVALALAFCGCSIVPVTPARLNAVSSERHAAKENLQKWQEAVAICNAFLASPARQTLPPGRLRLTEEGMEFVGADFTLPCRVRCTRWGDILVAFKMLAQERSDGFVVGRVRDDGDRLIDNSFFYHLNGRPAASATMAGLILHELTHIYYKLGTVDFVTGARYYAESIVRFTYRKHSMERLPFRTNAEFRAFLLELEKRHREREAPPAT